MNKHFLNLQLFGDDPAGGEPAGGEGGAGSGAAGGDPGTGGDGGQGKGSGEPKYTDAEVDALLNRKFAEWQKKQDKQISEAQKLGQMSAEEKANARMKALEDKLKEYETLQSKTEMTKQARSLLQDKGINVPDALIANLIADDAEGTKTSVESFANLFKAAVDAAVKEALKADVPKKGSGGTGITKEQIMAVKNRAERQKLIRENMELFS